MVPRFDVRVRRGADAGDGRGGGGGGGRGGHLVHVNTAGLYSTIGGDQVVNIERVILFRRSALHLETSVTGLLHCPEPADTTGRTSVNVKRQSS